MFFFMAPISVRPLYICHRKFCEWPERDGKPSCCQESETQMRLRRQNILRPSDRLSVDEQHGRRNHHYTSASHRGSDRGWMAWIKNARESSLGSCGSSSLNCSSLDFLIELLHPKHKSSIVWDRLLHSAHGSACPCCRTAPVWLVSHR